MPIPKLKTKTVTSPENTAHAHDGSVRPSRRSHKISAASSTGKPDKRTTSDSSEFTPFWGSLDVTRTSADPDRQNPSGLVAFFQGLDEHSEADDLAELERFGLTFDKAGISAPDIFSEPIGALSDCLTTEQLNLYIGAKGRLLRKRPDHLESCDDCRRAFEFFCRIRSSTLDAAKRGASGSIR